MHLWRGRVLASLPGCCLSPIRGAHSNAKSTRGGHSVGHGSTYSKQLSHGFMPRRIPGTTKVQYVNKKGRGYTFAIPVSTLTHPPVLRRAPGSSGGERVWHDMDTSFCDMGDLEEDMPSEVDECLRRCVQHNNTALPDDAAEQAGVIIRVDMPSLRELQRSFVSLCRDYVLMDTRGMTTCMPHKELNHGPDYEMYDRAAMRRRHWLAIRHRYEDVKELLWPSAALSSESATTLVCAENSDPPDEDRRVCADSATGPKDRDTVLSSMEMLDALQWLEAANTFRVRQRRVYDVAPESDFGPMDLQREVRVCLARARHELRPPPDVIAAPTNATAATRPHRHVAVPATWPISSSSTCGTLSLHESDTYIVCAALCAKYGVPLAHLSPLLSASSAHAVARLAGAAEDHPHIPHRHGDATGTTRSDWDVRAFVCGLPRLTWVREVVRAMHVMEGGCGAAAPPSPSPNPADADADADADAGPHVRPHPTLSSCGGDGLCFSDALSGEVVDVALWSALAQLCGCDALDHPDALESVDEAELCVVMRFLVRVYEANQTYFGRASSALAAAASTDGSVGGEAEEAKEEEGGGRCRGHPVAARGVSPGRTVCLVGALAHLTARTRARCRTLLLQTTVGEGATVVSGERGAWVPLATMSRHREPTSHPRVSGHHRIACRHAQGLRHAPLHTEATAALLDGAEKLTRLACGDRQRGAWVDFLASLTRHMTLVGTRRSGARLSLPAITRVLHIVAHMREDGATAVRPPPGTHLHGPPQRDMEGGGAGAGAGDGNEALYGLLAQSIAAVVSRPPGSLESVVSLLTAMARCGFVPHCYASVEATVLREILAAAARVVDGAADPTGEAAAAVLRQLWGALWATRRLVGVSGVSPVLMQCAARTVVYVLTHDHTQRSCRRRTSRAESQDETLATRDVAAMGGQTTAAVRVEAVRVLRVLRLCHFGSLGALVGMLHRRGVCCVAAVEGETEAGIRTTRRIADAACVVWTGGGQPMRWCCCCCRDEWACSVGILLAHAAVSMSDEGAAEGDGNWDDGDRVSQWAACDGDDARDTRHAPPCEAASPSGHVDTLLADAKTALESGLAGLAQCARPHTDSMPPRPCGGQHAMPVWHAVEPARGAVDSMQAWLSHDTTRAGELLVECGMACAALGDRRASVSCSLSEAMDAYVDGRRGEDDAPASGLCVHDGCTPHLAVSVLDSFAELGLHSAGARAMRGCYVAYIATAMQALLSASRIGPDTAAGPWASAPLMPEDAACVVRVLGLTEVPPSVILDATQVLLYALARCGVLSVSSLESCLSSRQPGSARAAAMDGYHDGGRTARAMPGGVGEVRFTSVEQQTMWRRGQSAALRDTVTRYVAAMRQNEHAAALLQRVCEAEKQAA